MLVAAAQAATHKPLPVPIMQFSTHIETTAHQLNATSDYPPYKRYMTVYYDFTARRARVDYDPVPHMPPKSFGARLRPRHSHACVHHLWHHRSSPVRPRVRVDGHRAPFDEGVPEEARAPHHRPGQKARRH